MAVEKWPTMTSKEIEIVCGSSAEIPSTAKRFDGGGAHVWLNESEAHYWETRQ